jgi:hypothetical protein
MRCLPTEDEAKARGKIDQAIRDRMYEEETGMPAVSQWMQPADAVARQSNGESADQSSSASTDTR